jgi:hypothetical protein
MKIITATPHAMAIMVPIMAGQRLFPDALVMGGGIGAITGGGLAVCLQRRYDGFAGNRLDETGDRGRGAGRTRSIPTLARRQLVRISPSHADLSDAS